MTSLGPTVEVIQASRGLRLDLRGLWDYRELLFFLAKRDVQVRYRQTAFGVAWVVLQPLLSTILFTLIFGRLAQVPSAGHRYELFALAGLVPWLFFASAITRGANSLVGSGNLLTKIYFPRLIIPAAGVLSGAIDLLFMMILTFGLMSFYRTSPSVSALALPILMVLLVLAALGVSFWLAALNVYYRDVAAVLPFATNLWLFATPVIYPASLVPQRWILLYGLNPMAGVVEGVRWALLASGPPPVWLMAQSAVVTLVLFVSGAFFFKRMERTFADVV